MAEEHHEEHETKEEIKTEIKEHEKLEDKIDFKKLNFWMLASIVLAIALIVMFLVPGLNPTGKVVSDEEAGTSVIDFLNSKVGGGVELVGVEDKGDIYEVNVLYQEMTIPVYITKDGKYFVQGIEEITDEPVEPIQQQDTPEPADMPKTNIPIVELFVWSFCPGGVSGENTLFPAIDLLGDTINSKVVFIGPVTKDKARAASSCFAGRGKEEADAINACCATYDLDGEEVYSCALHNQEGNYEESYESARQACIMDNYDSESFWTYLNEYNSKCLASRNDEAAYTACIDSAMENAGVDKNKINTCMEDGTAIELLMEDSDRSAQLDVHASPSLYINGVAFNGGRSASAWKQGICDAFNEAPEECGEEVAAAASNTNSNAQCG